MPRTAAKLAPYCVPRGQTPLGMLWCLASPARVRSLHTRSGRMAAIVTWRTVPLLEPRRNAQVIDACARMHERLRENALNVGRFGVLWDISDLVRCDPESPIPTSSTDLRPRDMSDAAAVPQTVAALRTFFSTGATFPLEYRKTQLRVRALLS